MARDDAPEGLGAGVLALLLAPLRLPGRMLGTLDSLAGAARELAAMRSELTRVREQTEPLADLMPAVERLVRQTEPVPDVAGTVEQIRRQAEPLAELLPALSHMTEELVKRLDELQAVIVALEGNESHLNVTSRKLVEELVAMHKTVDGLQDDIERITDRLPESGEKRGPLKTAREVLSGNDT